MTYAGISGSSQPPSLGVCFTSSLANSLAENLSVIPTLQDLLQPSKFRDTSCIITKDSREKQETGWTPGTIRRFPIGCWIVSSRPPRRWRRARRCDTPMGGSGVGKALAVAMGRVPMCGTTSTRWRGSSPRWSGRFVSCRTMSQRRVLTRRRV